MPFVHPLVEPVMMEGIVTSERPVFGPELPPEMIWERMFKSMIPDPLSTSVPLSLRQNLVQPMEPIVLSKRSWSVAFDPTDDFEMFWTGESAHSGLQGQLNSPVRRKVARALSFEPVVATDDEPTLPPVFIGSPSTPVGKKRRGRPPKVSTPASEAGFRRSTRNKLKNDGHRPTPAVTSHLAVSQPRKRARATPLQGKKNKSADADAELIPKTPLQSMQAVGIALGIDPVKLTKEMLEADPIKAPSKK